MALPPTPSVDSPGAAPYQDPADAAELARLDAFRERLARKPWVTWTLALSIALMFGLQALLGGVDDPWVMIRLGGQVPDDIAAGEYWRLVSGAFLHSGAIHFGLNVWVLIVVGGGLERLIGGARLLLAYGVSVILASLAALVFSDAPLTVGASGGVFGLFGVELVVVLLRPELLPAEVRGKHARSVLTNLVLNVANSFRPNIAMAAHFGGGLAGAVLGLVLVPRTFEDDRDGAPLWVKIGAALSGGVLALGVVLALVHAMGDAGVPATARTPIHGITDPAASAEIPTTLAPSSTPGTFGDIQHDPAVISVQRFLELGDPPEDLASELESAPMPAEYRALGASEARIAGRRAVVARYEAIEAPLFVERVLVRDDTTAWLVESVYWASTASAWDGVAATVAGSIEEEEVATGERIALVCDRWSALLPAGASARTLVACGDPVTDAAHATRGVAGMIGRFEIGLGSCTLTVRTLDVPLAFLPESSQHAPAEGETFAVEVGVIDAQAALRVLSRDAAFVARFEPSDPVACDAPMRRVRDIMRRTIETTALAAGGEVEMSLGRTGDRMAMTLPAGAYVTSLGGAPPDASTGHSAHDVTYELRVTGNAARALWSSDIPVLEPRMAVPPLVTTLVDAEAGWTTQPDPDGEAGATREIHAAWLRRDRRVSFFLYGPVADREALRTILETSRVVAP